MRHGRLLCIFLFSLVFVFPGCDRIRDSVSLAQPTVKTESRELSMESLIDRMVGKDKEIVEEAHTKGRTRTVGLVDGKRWLEDSFDRSDYIRGLADLISAMAGIAEIVVEESGELDQQKKVQQRSDAQENPSGLVAAYEAIRIFLLRIGDVTHGHSFGDTVDAITKFYRDKPLMKNKPVVWVLAVPLCNQLQEAKPPDKRENENNTVTVPIKTNQKGKNS